MHIRSQCAQRATKHDSTLVYIFSRGTCTYTHTHVSKWDSQLNDTRCTATHTTRVSCTIAKVDSRICGAPGHPRRALFFIFWICSRNVFFSAFCFISRHPNRNVQQEISRVALPSHQLLIPGTVLLARCSSKLVFSYTKRCACSMPMYIRYLSQNSKWSSCSSTFLSLDFVNALFIRRKIKRNTKKGAPSSSSPSSGKAVDTHEGFKRLSGWKTHENRKYAWTKSASDENEENRKIDDKTILLCTSDWVSIFRCFCSLADDWECGAHQI